MRLGLLLALLLSAAALGAAADLAARGKQLFESRCTGCHAPDADKEGPRLRGVYGRPAASIRSFACSDGLRNSHIVWDTATLDKWLTDPEKLAPDADMAFRMPDPDARSAVIEYLKQLR